MSVTERNWLSKPTDLVPGTLDLLILKVIAPGPMHGWAIAKYYRLTKAGRRILEQEAAPWERLPAAISLVVETT